MARKSPTIIFTSLDKNFQSDNVFEAEYIYAVHYKGKPINRRRSDERLTNRHIYRRTSFLNESHAHKLAAELNAKFETTEFEVYRHCAGEKVEAK